MSLAVTSPGPRATAALVALVAVGLAGCPSGPRGGGTGPATGGGALGGGDAGVASVPVADAATAPNLTEPECARLVDHVLEVQLVKMRVELPPEKVPTDEQVATIRASLGEEMMPACLSAFDRAAYDCMMAATTVEALYACAGPADADSASVE